MKDIIYTTTNFFPSHGLGQYRSVYPVKMCPLSISKKGQNKAFVCAANTHYNEEPKQFNRIHAILLRIRVSGTDAAQVLKKFKFKIPPPNTQLIFQSIYKAHFSIIILQECIKLYLEQLCLCFPVKFSHA